MRVQIDGSGNVTDVERPDHLLSSGTVVAFPIGPPSAATGWPVGFTVTGTAGSRVLKDPHGQTLAVEEPTQTAPVDAGASGDSLPAAQSFTPGTSHNYETGVGTYNIMVIPDGAGYVFGVKHESDDFPRLVITDVGDWVIGDGTYDPTNHPVSYVGMQMTGGGLQLRGGGSCYLALGNVVGGNNFVQVQGDLRFSSSSDGPVLVSPNGHHWRQTISDAGVVSWTDLGP